MTVIKQNPPNCRRELVNAYTSKPTAKKKIWNTVKRLHIDGDKTVPSKLPSAGVWEKTCFALINAFCFGKAAGLRRKCIFAYFCCYGQKYVPRHGMSRKPFPNFPYILTVHCPYITIIKQINYISFGGVAL